MATPAEVVQASFDQAKRYADSATGMLSGFTSALNQSIYSAPAINVTFTPPLRRRPLPRHPRSRSIPSCSRLLLSSLNRWS